MQFLYATLYVLLHFARSWLGSRLMSLRIEATRRSHKRTGRHLIQLAVSTILILIIYIQYYLLTGYFPIILVLVLIMVGLIMRGLVFLLHAALGLDTPEKAEKIQALSRIWGFAAGRSLAVLLLPLLLFNFLC